MEEGPKIYLSNRFWACSHSKLGQFVKCMPKISCQWFQIVLLLPTVKSAMLQMMKSNVLNVKLDSHWWITIVKVLQIKFAFKLTSNWISNWLYMYIHAFFGNIVHLLKLILCWCKWYRKLCFLSIRLQGYHTRMWPMYRKQLHQLSPRIHTEK